jgi:hypothetical protein
MMRTTLNRAKKPVISNWSTDPYMIAAKTGTKTPEKMCPLPD